MKQPPEARKYLDDIQHACMLLRQFTDSKTFEDYRSDALLRSGVERQFMIIGEAFGQMLRSFPELKSNFPEAPKIVSFRNLLVHGYGVVADDLVWGILEEFVPPLEAQIRQALKDQ